MNTNEFRHPKERLQNLSSRHKVSNIYFVASAGSDERMSERSQVGSQSQIEDLSVSMCLPVMYRLAGVQLGAGVTST